MNRELQRLREDRIHGLPTYPISIYEVTETDGQTLFDTHWHDELEFMLITEGRIRVQLDMDEYVLEEGQAVFVNSGMLHGAFPTDTATCSLYAIVFHPEFLASRTKDILQTTYIEPILSRQIQLPAVIRGESPTERSLIERLRSIITTNTTRSGAYELVTKSDLYMSMAYLLEDRQPNKRPSRAETQQVERLKQVLSYIHRHYQETIRLQDLAEELGMSVEHLCRSFKKMMKKSPVAYINEYRMQQAKLLLADTDERILDIALQVGFDNLSYFITVFKAHCGVTPSQYRKQLQKQEFF